MIRFIYLYRRRILGIFCLLLVLFFLFRHFKCKELPAVLKHYQEISHQLLKNDSIECKFPELNPWDSTILKYYEKVEPLKCTSLQLNGSYIENGFLKLNKEMVSSLCQYRYVYHNEGIDDFNPKYGNWITITEDVKLTSDIIEILCKKSSIIPISNYNYVWSHVVPRSTSIKTGQVFAKGDPEKQPSLIILGIDSMSLSNFIRQLPKTYSRLKQLNFQIMRHHVKVADNTYPNLIAMLTGKRGYTTSEFKAELNENWNIAFDDFPFIWNDFASRGFATLFSEDRPEMATFNYQGRLKGFLKQPVDHYLRPFYLSFFQNLLHRRSVLGCYDSNPLHVLKLNYLQSFLEAYSDKKKFAMFWTQDLSHNLLNAIGAVDADLDDFFVRNKQSLDEAVFVVISDHGNRFDSIRQTTIGRYEVRLPFLAIRIPEKLDKKYPELRRNLADNSKKMTTHFDVYATFKQILEANFDKTSSETKQRGYSLFSKLPSTRTCFQAQIPEEYCPCVKEISIPIVDALEPTRALLDYINLLSTDNKDFSPPNTKCAVLELESIIDAFVRLVPSHILVDPEVDNQTADDTKITYRVMLKTKAPSNAILEALIVHDFNANSWYVLGEIDRNNAYGNSSYCVKSPLLKKTCHCLIY